MMENPQRVHFDLIDPLRGFAAISVVIYHVIELTGWQTFPDSFGLGWFKWGWMGTDIFFVISGFVISHSALSLLDRYNYQTAIKHYIRCRLQRIVPLHYLTLLFFVLAFSEITDSPDFWPNLLSHLSFIHNWFPAFHRTLNAPNWTLGTEMQFYILLILLIPYVTLNNLKYFIAGAFLVAFAWRGVAFFFYHGDSVKNIDQLFMAATQLPGMLDFFALGMALAFFARTKLYDAFRQSSLAKTALLMLMLLWGLLAFNTFINARGYYWHLYCSVIFARSMLAILFALLILYLSAFSLSPKLRRWLGPLIYLGVISYGIYLLHWPLLLLIKDLDLSHIAKLVITLGGAIILASVSWHFYESHFLAKKSGMRS